MSEKEKKGAPPEPETKAARSTVGATPAEEREAASLEGSCTPSALGPRLPTPTPSDRSRHVANRRLCYLFPETRSTTHRQAPHGEESRTPSPTPATDLGSLSPF